MAHQRSTSSEESPPKTASDWYRGNGSGPRRVQTITRTSRKSTSEYGTDLCVLPHGECGLQTQLQQLRVQIPRWSARGLGRETREGQEKGQTTPSQENVALRRLWRGQLKNSSRRWSCFSCGAKPPESGASSAAAQPKKRPVSHRQNFAEAVAHERRRVQAALPMEPRSQADSEATDVKIDEDSSQDRDKGNTKELGNKLKDLDAVIRQLQPCARTRAWLPCWRRRSRSATSSRYSCRTTSPFISAYAWPRMPGRRPARLSRVSSGKRRTSWCF